MSAPTKKVKKVVPNPQSPTDIYDIVPTMMTDSTGTYKAELPTLQEDDTIELKPFVAVLGVDAELDSEDDHRFIHISQRLRNAVLSHRDISIMANGELVANYRFGSWQLIDSLNVAMYDSATTIEYDSTLSDTVEVLNLMFYVNTGSVSTDWIIVNNARAGQVSDITINGASILSGGVANIAVEGTYNSSSNKIATMDAIPVKDVKLDNTSVVDTNGIAQFNEITKAEIDEICQGYGGQGVSPIRDIQIDGYSILNDGVANIQTNTAYDASSNKIATMNDLPRNYFYVDIDDLVYDDSENRYNVESSYIWRNFLTSLTDNYIIKVGDFVNAINFNMPGDGIIVKLFEVTDITTSNDDTIVTLSICENYSEQSSGFYYTGATLNAVGNTTTVAISNIQVNTVNSTNILHENDVIIDGNKKIGFVVQFASESSVVVFTALDLSGTVVNANTGTTPSATLTDLQVGSTVYTIPSGTVTSVGMSVPTGFTLSGSPITTSGTFNITLASGYELLNSNSAQTINGTKTFADGINGLSSSSDTPLHLQGNTTSTWIEFKNANGTSLGYIGVDSAGRPAFYDTTTKVILTEDNATFVRYNTNAQGLTDTQKSNARTNIGAGTSSFSGDYDDLTNKPTIPAAQVQTDWNATTGMGVLLNKPNLATVATSGSYNDLSNKPTIPSLPSYDSSKENYVLSVDSSGNLVWKAPYDGSASGS